MKSTDEGGTGLRDIECAVDATRSAWLRALMGIKKQKQNRQQASKKKNMINRRSLEDMKKELKEKEEREHELEEKERREAHIRMQKKKL